MPRTAAGIEAWIRAVAAALWILVGIAETLLLLRIVAVLVWGINGDLSAPAKAPGFIYTVTGLGVNDLIQAANFIVPYQGLRHGFDVAALMAMVILFFGCLAVTKIALWTSRAVTDRAIRDRNRV